MSGVASPGDTRRERERDRETERQRERDRERDREIEGEREGEGWKKRETEGEIRFAISNYKGIGMAIATLPTPQYKMRDDHIPFSLGTCI